MKNELPRKGVGSVIINNDFVVLSAIREADHAVSPRYLAPQLNLSPAEMYQSILSLKHFLRKHAYDKNASEGDCRYFVASETRQQADELITDKLRSMPDNLYFSYGSNMDYYQLYSRCANAHFLTRASIKDSSLSFPRGASAWGGNGVAGFRPEKGSELLGVIYFLPYGDFARLDGFEGSPRCYERNKVMVQTQDFGEIEVMTYIADEEGDFFPPSKRYMEQMVTGARIFNLDPVYIQRLLRIPTVVE
jgi:hypothetical protein